MAQEGIFTRFEDDDKIPGQVNIVSSGMWSGGIGTLTSFYTSSTQTGSSGAHYFDIYNGEVGSDATASVQFSVAFGDFHGSGSKTGDNDPASTAFQSHNHGTFDIEMDGGSMKPPASHPMNDISIGSVTPQSLDNALNIIVDTDQPYMVVVYLIKAF